MYATSHSGPGQGPTTTLAPAVVFAPHNTPTDLPEYCPTCPDLMPVPDDLAAEQAEADALMAERKAVGQ